MAPKANSKKRERDNDDDVDPTQSSSKTAKVKNTPGKAKAEKSQDAVARVTQLAIQYRDANEPAIDPSSRSTEQLHDEWLETYAQALAREHRFLTIMENPPDLSGVTPVEKWLANVHLDRRYRTYKDFAQFKKKVLTKEFKSAIVQRAFEILEQCALTAQTSMDDTIIAPPPDSDDAQQLREKIFFYHVFRNRLLEALKSANDHEHVLLKRLLAGDTGTVVQEVDEIEESKAEIRDMIKNCKADVAGKECIDQLLAQVPAKLPPLYQLPNDVVDTALEKTDTSQADEIPQQSIDQKIQAINMRNPSTTIRHYDNTISGQVDVLLVRNTASAEPLAMPEGPVISQLGQYDDFGELDAAIHNEIENTSGDINVTRFKLNFEAFASIKDRPEVVKNVKAKAGLFTNAYARLALVRDNLLHVKVLAAKLLANDMLKSGVKADAFNDCLRRLFALAALMYGCISEGSLWLTVMDALLEDLSQLLRGSVDPRMLTSRMEQFRRSRESGTDPKSAQPLSEAEITELETNDRAREIFAELARFYRGAILMSYMGVSLKSKGAKDQNRNWFTNLLRWSDQCGSETCVENLVVTTIPEDAKKEEGNEMDVDEGDGAVNTASKKTRADYASRSQYGLSIGVFDTRIGFPAERSEISENREWAYPCLYDIVNFQKYHAGWGPFLHYYGHIYHSPCQPGRDKVKFEMSVLSATK